MERSKEAQEIIDVLDYKDGDYYVGSLATCQVFSILRLEHILEDWPQVNIRKALNQASSKDIDKAHNYLRSYIQHMKANLKQVCPHCGSIISAKRKLK